MQSMRLQITEAFRSKTKVQQNSARPRAIKCLDLGQAVDGTDAAMDLQVRNIAEKVKVLILVCQRRQLRIDVW